MIYDVHFWRYFDVFICPFPSLRDRLNHFCYEKYVIVTEKLL